MIQEPPDPLVAPRIIANTARSQPLETLDPLGGPKSPIGRRIRGHVRLSDQFLAVPALKNEFIISVASATGSEPLQREPSVPVEVEDLLRFCYLKWVTADPVDQIVPDRHPPGWLLLAQYRRWQRILQANQPARTSAQSPEHAHQSHNRQPENRWRA